MALAVSVALILGVTMLDVPILRAPLALAWTCFAGAALLCYLVLVQMVSLSARGAQLLSALIVFPLIMIGGSFFPFETMPAWMANIGRWTPNGLAVVQVKQILFGEIDWRALLLAAIAIGIPAAAAFAIAVRRLTGAFGAT
jgi:ABC-type multidrug transport system permease subunit